MNEELSPEERLLNLIRGKPKTSSDSEDHSPPPSTPDKEKLTISKAKKAVFRILERKKLWARISATKNPDFKLAPKVLSSLCLLLLAYLAFDYIDTPKTPEELSIGKVVKKGERKEKPLLTMRPYSYYSREIEKRDIFRPYRELKPEFPSALPGPKRVTLRERVANLSLRGIVLDEEPQAIIVDNKEKKTYFLNKGQFIREIKIEDILKGKVILSYQGERLDLRL